MIDYLIKSTLCSGILIALFHLLLQREKMFRFNRFYLLGALIFSLGIPLVKVEIHQKVLVAAEESRVPYSAGPTKNTLVDRRVTKVKQVTSKYPFSYIFWLYGIVTAVMLIRFTRNIWYIHKRGSGCQTIHWYGSAIVLTAENFTPFTFLNKIYIPAEAFNQGYIRPEILAHESTHARQMHSLDILVIELLQALMWFNPFLIYYKKAIRLNHEFLADDAVLAEFTDIKGYRLLLIDTMLHPGKGGLASSFNYSITKKRLAMMTNIQNIKMQYMKKSATLITALLLSFIFSEKIYSQRQTGTLQIEESNKKKIQSAADLNDSVQGVTEKEIEQFYLTIQKHTIDLPVKNGRSQPEQTIRMAPALRNRLYYIYTKMTALQKQAVADSGYMLFQMPVPVKKSPDPAMFENWKRADIFGVWIDEKQVPNTELNKYRYTDIVEYDLSKLYGAARKGRSYKYQLDLSTNAHFDKNLQERVDNRVYLEKRVRPDKTNKTSGR